MFERNRNVRDPRAVASLLSEAEKEVERMSHPDPYRRESLLLLDLPATKSLSGLTTVESGICHHVKRGSW